MNRSFVSLVSAAALTLGGLTWVASGATAADQPSAAAAPSFSGSGSAHALDLTVLSAAGIKAAQVSLATAEGAANSASSPRAVADAANLEVALLTGNAPSPALLAHARQTAPPDHPTGDSDESLPLHIPGLLDLDVSTATANARWAGDDACFASGTSVQRSTVSTADAELLGVAGLGKGLLKLNGAVATSQSTRLEQLSSSGGRAVISNAVGSAAGLELLNGAVHVQVAQAPVLTATATGTPGGARVDWQAPLVTVNGSALNVANSPLNIISPDNPLLALELSLGQKTNVVTSGEGTTASGKASVLHVKLKLLGITIVEADLFPLSVSATAPAGGVDCPDPADKDTDGDGLTDVEETTGSKNPFGNQPTDPTKADTDGDGLNDLEEVSGSKNPFNQAPTNPNIADSDGDGLNDGQEVSGSENPFSQGPTNPLVADTDGDGLTDNEEVTGSANAFDGKPTNPVAADTDGDGLTDKDENGSKNTAFGNKATNPNLADTDGDTLTDGQEVTGSENDAFAGAATDPTKSDTDGDGLTDGQEIPVGTENDAFNNLPTNPNKTDTDDDGLSDKEEVTGSKNTFANKPTNPNAGDTDKDGLTDGEETSGSKNTAFGGKATDPLDADSDDDGLTDQEETSGSKNAKFGNEPTDPLVADTDKGSVNDGTETSVGTDPNDPSDDKPVPFALDRVAGDDRYDTSARVALKFGSSDKAILASGQGAGYADALSGNYFAGTLNAPMLLTKTGSTPASVTDALVKLGVKTVYVMGGPAAINDAQVKALREKGYQVVRLEGSNRFKTNAQVISAAGDSSSDTAIVATGLDFPDALAGGPLSYNEGMPLALTKTNDIPDDVVIALRVARVSKVLIVGGASAVGPEVVKELNDAGITVSKRFAGADRSSTSILIADYAVDMLNFTKTAVDIASGYGPGTGADALSGSSLAGRLDRPLVITGSASDPDDVITYLKQRAGTLVTGTIFGGPAAITTLAEAIMEKTVNDNRPPVTTG